jgi:phosphosulfolactate synthase (CoM biosynthesis protein A)
MDTLIRRAERCLEAGADMIMVDAEGITKDVDVWRTDLIARMARRLGLQRIMFEANEPESVQWFVNRYGSRVMPLDTNPFASFCF